jgi:hypothetical protein
MKPTNPKILPILATALILITTLGALGYSYACWNGGIHINCYCNCDVKFTSVITSDNEFEKEVADVTAEITCDGNTINAYTTNAYPCYEAYINYTIKNTGYKPVHFDTLTIINNHPEALEITTTNHTCTLLPPGDMVQGTTAVHILQPAEQDWEYNFQIKIGFSCQEGYPHTIGFWKNQFSSCTCKNGNPQVPAATLLQYLNQISNQSPYFEFTGSQKDKFKQALDILSPSTNANMKAKLKAQLLAQLLALWLNYVAGWTDGYKLDGMTAKQIIDGAENALKTGQTTKYEYWKDLCDDFNNLG